MFSAFSEIVHCLACYWEGKPSELIKDNYCPDCFSDRIADGGQENGL